MAMNRSLATALALSAALAAGVSGTYAASAQTAQLGQAARSGEAGPQCNDFLKLRADAQQKASLVKAASLKKDDRKGMCDALTRFSAAEELAVKFLESNMSWCGIPPQVITDAKTNHEKTVKFRTVVCTENPAPRPRPPTLSDAISTPSVDTGKNTKTGEGTFDTLTGNPLAK
jgi:hypothetical protein